jgi:glycosyltransferase involved in cell wall biosynthesis
MMIKTKPEDIHICVNSSDGTHSIERTIPLAEKGFKISFIAHKEFDRIDELEKFKNVKVYLLGKINPQRKYLRLPIYIKLVKDLNPDLIIVHYCGYDRFQAAVFSSIKPIVGIIMGGEVDTKNCKVPFQDWLEFKFTRLLLPYVEFLASKTNVIVEKLKMWNLKGSIAHIPWGVKINNSGNTYSGFDTKEKIKIETRKKLGLPENKFIILTNRNIAEAGRQLEIVKGFHELIKKEYNIHLLVVVRHKINSYFDIIKKYIEENKLDANITILDYIPQNIMFKYYDACDVLISNWIHDGMPQTFFEASLRGLPIIMNDLTQYRDFYKDNESAMINDGTYQGIMNFVDILYNKVELRKKLSENGYNVVVEKANFDKWSEYFIDELLKLLDSGKKIRIPSYKLLMGKFLIGIIFFAKRLHFIKIKV